MPIFNLFSDITYNLSNVDSSNHLMLFKLRLGTLVKTVPMCDSPAMAQEISVIVGAVDPARSAAIAGGRSRPLEHVRPARPVLLLPAVCVAAAEVARRTGVGEPAGRRWRRRFTEYGVDGLLRGRTHWSPVRCLGF